VGARNALFTPKTGLRGPLGSPEASCRNRILIFLYKLERAMIYVDDAGIEKGGHKWYHLISDDPNDAELHAFAKKVGLRCWWYQHDH